MIQLKGRHNEAIVFTNKLEETAQKQIIELCDQEFAKDSKIRIMPDVHAGAGCTIGTTMTIQDKIVPNLVGTDIGCGMLVTKIDIEAEKINFDELDTVIRKFVPSGLNVRERFHEYSHFVPFNKIIMPLGFTDMNRAMLSVGSLGGGNHFIELNQGTDGSIYLVIHSGSRSLGSRVAKYYQKKAYEELVSNNSEREEIISRLKSEGRDHEIQDELEFLKSKNNSKINRNLAYLEGNSFNDYMNDMQIAQTHADMNRQAMAKEIIDNMNWSTIESWTSAHNFIDVDNLILRKGATSAQKHEKLIIPMNMRDGSIIATGRGNKDWNQSAPHGAGRVLSRSKAFKKLNLEEFQNTMKDVWTSSVEQSTLDESPMAYKPMDEILTHVKDTIVINDIIKPLYNFKATS